jgi:membrane-associated phospholipid phosphatase
MFRPIDIITIGYLFLLNVLILVFHHNLQRPSVFIALHLGIVLVILILVALAQKTRNWSVQFFREWYPGLFFIFGFEEIDHLVDMVTPQRIHQVLMAMDRAIFGVHPTVWLGQYARPWLTELMMFCFCSFYFSIPLLGLVLYFKKKRWQLRELLLASAVAFYICFMVFIFLPAEGPWVTMVHMHPEPLRGGLFTWLVSFVEGRGSIRGGAFPSSHVAIGLVVLVMACRHQRTMFWVLLPIISGLFVSTVYCRFHYAVDVLSGLLVGVVGLIIGGWMHRKWARGIRGKVLQKK